MLEPSHNDELPAIPGKRYFTIGEVSELCAVKPHVLRYWEQEFPQLNPVKRRGNRRYYQRQDVLMIRPIRALLYDQGFTIGDNHNTTLIGDLHQQATLALQGFQTPRDLLPAEHDFVTVLRAMGKDVVDHIGRDPALRLTVLAVAGSMHVVRSMKPMNMDTAYDNVDDASSTH